MKRSKLPKMARWMTTGRCARVVLADVGQVEALRRVRVELDGRALPLAAERVGDVDVDLRSVESAPRSARRVEGDVVLRRAPRASDASALSQSSSVAHHLLGVARRELERRLHAEDGVDPAHEREQRASTSASIWSRRKKMCASSCWNWRTRVRPAERARRLVAMQHVLRVEAQRQIAVAVQLHAVDEVVRRAVHRLEAERLLLGLDLEHVLRVVLPVARLSHSSWLIESGVLTST